MKIKIKVEALPLHFLILGGFLILYAVLNLAAQQAVILNSVLLFVGVLMLTSHQALQLNLDKKVYSEYYWVLGLKLSNYTEQYQKLTSVECTTGTYSQEYGKYNRRFISGTMYKGYITLEDQESIYLGQSKSKSALLKKLTKLSAKLEVPIKDQTE